MHGRVIQGVSHEIGHDLMVTWRGSHCEAQATSGGREGICFSSLGRNLQSVGELFQACRMHIRAAAAAMAEGE